ncbi:MAG: molybdate ABC transporter substrate-binding protein [Candidatus Thiodiazotropha sp.]
MNLRNLLFGLTLCSSLASAGEVRIAVAANFTDATKAIAPLFEAATGHTTKISYGSTGKLYAQIEHGAPFEVFLAADIQRPEKAEQQGLAINGTRFVYAQGKLALWSADPNRFTSGESFLASGDFSHVALANPKTAPYGLAADQVMSHLGLLEALRAKRVQGDSIAQTFQFAATGNADAGFVALSQVNAWKGNPGSLWVIPADFYAPIEQAAVLLKKGEHNPAAQAYLDFLKSEEAREVIERFGYGVGD